MQISRCLTLFTALATSVVGGEWSLIPENEIPKVLQLAESSLKTQWNSSSRGWCRGISYHSIQPDGTDGPVKLEVAWDKKNVGIMIYRCDTPISDPPIFHSTPDAMLLQSSVTEWNYTRDGNMLYGSKITSSKGFNPNLEIRPQQQWLKVLQYPINHLGTIEKIKKQGVQASRHDDGRVQIYSRLFRMEFDPRLGFGIVLFEYAMDTDKLIDDEKTANPKRFRYELACDAHGVWYCKDVMLSQWPVGGGGAPQDTHIMTVLEYDSDPPPEKMHLDYKTLPIPPDTQVTSTIPGKSGQWVYGKEKAEQTEIEGAAFRNLGGKMRTRGFSRTERGQVP